MKALCLLLTLAILIFYPILELEGQTKEVPPPTLSGNEGDSIDEFMNGLGDNMLAGQVLMLHLNRDKAATPEKGLLPEFRKLIHDLQPGGIILYAENILDPEQTLDLTRSIQAELLIPGFVAIDEEGGRVSRLQRSEAMKAAKIPSAMRMANNGPAAVWYGYWLMGRELAALGINMDFAPVCDLSNLSPSDIVGDRALGSSVFEIETNTRLAVNALRASNVIPVVKHFPGHGRSTGDSHFETEEIKVGWDELMKADLKPFISAFRAGAGGVMTAHIWFSGIEKKKLPVSMSPLLIQEKLKKELGFNGIVFTDALDMQGVLGYGDSSKSGVQSLVAGSDMLLCPVSPRKQHQAIMDAVKKGDLGHERLNSAVQSILRQKVAFGLLKIKNGSLEKTSWAPRGDADFSRLSPSDILGTGMSRRILEKFVLNPGK